MQNLSELMIVVVEALFRANFLVTISERGRRRGERWGKEVEGGGEGETDTKEGFRTEGGEVLPDTKVLKTEGPRKLLG